MSSIKIEKTDSQIIVYSPYHPDFPKKARQIGGKWDDKVWKFDQKDEERVRDLCLQIYGEDGRVDPERVTIRYKCSGYKSKTFYVANRCVAYRPSRDTSVRLSEGVIVIEGEFADHGGSVKNPAVDNVDGILLEIRDVPRSLAEPELNENCWIVEESNRKEKLLKEKEALQARLAEIEEELKAL